VTADPTPGVVAELLRRHLDRHIQQVEISRGSVGNGQETWFVRAHGPGTATRDLVLRRSAAAGPLDHTDRGREFAVLRALAGTGLPVPAAHWVETDGATLGRPYFVMDRLPGLPPTGGDRDQRDRLARQLGGALAALHALPLAIAPDVLTRPADAAAATSQEVSAWTRRYEEHRLGEMPVVGALFAWLAARVPSRDAPLVLLWGDPGPHNTLRDGFGLCALLDWELAHIGHPLEDLGNAVWSCLGSYDPEQVVAGYEESRGEPVDRDELAYFTVLGCLTRSVMQVTGVRSYVAGSTSAPNLAGLGLVLPVANLLRAAAFAGWPRVVEPEPPGLPAPDPLRSRPDVGETLAGVSRFLRDDLLAATTSPVLIRGLKTSIALLDTAAARAAGEPVLDERLARERDALLAGLAAAGVSTGGGLEAAAVQVERNPAYAGMRDRLRRHLLADLTARFTLLRPLRDLYGSAVAVRGTAQDQ